MGIVTEIGAGVALLKVGDRVVMPFNVSGLSPLSAGGADTSFVARSAVAAASTGRTYLHIVSNQTNTS